MTAKELMDIIDEWLDQEPASDWGVFEFDLYDLLVLHGYYKSKDGES